MPIPSSFLPLRRPLRASLLALAALAACDGTPPPDDLGVVTLAATGVPADVRCIRFAADAGARQVVRALPVSAGAATFSATIAGIPTGEVTVSVDAFSSTCAGITAASPPSWLSDAVDVRIVAGVPLPLALALRPAGRIDLQVHFDADAGAPPPAEPSISASAVVLNGSGVAFSGTIRAGGSIVPGSYGVGEDQLDGDANRSFLTFDLSAIPAGAVVTNATFSMTSTGCFNIDGHGDVLVEPVPFGSLQGPDFAAPASAAARVFFADRTAGRKSVDVTAWTADYLRDRAIHDGRVQLRVRLTPDVVPNGVRGVCGFPTSQTPSDPGPRLDVTYRLP